MKPTLHNKYMCPKEHWCRPRATVYGDTWLPSVIVSGRRQRGRGPLLGLSWALTLFCPPVTLVSLFYSQSLPTTLLSFYLETQLSPAFLADHSHPFLTFVLICFLCLNCHLSGPVSNAHSLTMSISHPSLGLFCPFYLLFYMDATFCNLHCQEPELNMFKK